MRVRSALLPAILLLALAAHSAFAAAPRLQTQILGQSSWLSGSRASLRLRALDHSTGLGVANAQIRISLGEAGKAQLLLSSTTDAEGNLTAQFQVPDLPKGSYPMTVEVSALGEKDVVTRSIGVRGETRLLVTTDKPLYQPNQVIHLRALALKEPDLKPLAGAPVTLEVEDSKGNKVFKRSGLTSEYGVAFADFTLADEINLGTYRVRAVADSGTQEQTVTVSKYVLPKFKVAFAADRAFYRPGETMTGQVQADYFFGKPVAGKVSIKLSQFDTGFTDFALVTGTLDAAGHFSFTQKLPDYFAGVPLEQGAAFVKVETTVTDSADQSSTITSTAPVAQDSLRVTAIMEGGQLVSGVDNIVYLVVTTPDGQPTAADLTVKVNGGDASTVSTDASGLAEFHVNGGTGTVNLSVTARDAQGYTGSLKQDLYAGYASTSILARPDKAIYRVGDSLQLDVLTTTKTGTVYVDAIKDGQTMSTAAANIEAGKASVVVNLGPELAGTLELHAYQITKEGQIIRSSRTVVVNPANDLKISVQSDAATYAPGGTANLTLHVTNAANAGVAAALGVNIVDESVFALQDMQPGMEKVYFLLEKQILQPKFEIHA
ncbi:MAG TPA: MG2 domain-containing protein, partial [Armatimonadota bacterium]